MREYRAGKDVKANVKSGKSQLAHTEADTDIDNSKPLTPESADIEIRRKMLVDQAKALTRAKSAVRKP